MPLKNNDDMARTENTSFIDTHNRTSSIGRWPDRCPSQEVRMLSFLSNRKVRTRPAYYITWTWSMV